MDRKRIRTNVETGLPYGTGNGLTKTLAALGLELDVPSQRPFEKEKET